MNSGHAEKLLVDFINSITEPLNEENLIRQFDNYLRENFADVSFAWVAHIDSPWPYRILTPGPFVEQSLPVFSGRPFKNNCNYIVKTKNLYMIPFRDHQQQVDYILLGLLADTRTRKTILSLCEYCQHLFQQVSWAAQFSTSQAENTYRGYINNLTHDFNSLLTLISMSNINDEGIRQKVNYGKKLTREFLFYLSDMELKKVPAEINELLNAVQQNFSTAVEITHSFPAGTKQILVMLDVELISKALQAILDNAIYFAGLVRGTIQIEISGFKNISPFIDHDWISLCIKNQGPVIPAEYLERIKEPFFTTLKDQGKVGLGLALADKITQAHGGCLTIGNRLNEGVQVTLYLPWEEKYV